MATEALKLEYNITKRKLFDRYYSHLNDKQKECVYTINGPLMILAGAGSGKTTVLVNRITHIIRYGDAVLNPFVPDDADERTIAEMNAALSLGHEELGDYLERFSLMAPPAWTVLAVTFTNKAANEIKERISAAMGEGSPEASEIWAGTFHSICVRILRRYGNLVGYDTSFEIADTDDSKKVITESMKELEIDTKNLPVKSVMKEISNAKNHLMTVEEFQNEFSKDVRLKQIGRIYELYQKKLASSNVLDFDDIIMQTVILLQKEEEVRKTLQNRFRYVSIDEYQDTNRAQFVLVSLLSDYYRNLMVVGDDDQSIYKFRGATVENILQFDKIYKDAKVIKLEQNYRSTKKILAAANSVIAKNENRHGKNLWSDGAEGEPISLVKLENQTEEARFISDTVSEAHESGEKFSDFAVLYRTNSMSRAIEQALSKSGIPYRMLGALRFFDRMEVKDIIGYLQVISNPQNSIALKRIINVPKRSIGDKSIAVASQIADETNQSLFSVLSKAEGYKAIPTAAAKSMVVLAQLLEAFITLSKSEAVTVSSLVENVIEKSGYASWLRTLGEEGKDRLENLAELISTASQYEEGTLTPTLSEFLEDVALVSDVDRYDEEADAVVLMTIHSAKGLEFKNVFLPGWEENVFPGFQTMINPSEMEEERRLAYVAITRAKKKLFITHAHSRMVNGMTQYNGLNGFAKDIPAFLVAREDRTSGSDDFFAGGFGKATPRSAAGNPIYNRNGAGAGWGLGSERAAYTGNVAPRRGVAPTASPAEKKTEPTKKKAPLEVFDKGDRVKHTTFGAGTVLSVRDMGGDALYEIEFDKPGIGVKKLMASFARLQKE